MLEKKERKETNSESTIWEVLKTK